MQRSENNRFSFLVTHYSIFLISLFTIGGTGCKHSVSPAETCKSVETVMQDLANERSVLALQPPSEQDPRHGAYACRYVVYFRSEGRFEKPDRLLEGVAIYIFQDEGQFLQHWADITEEESVISHAPSMDGLPSKIVTDSGSIETEFRKHRSRKIKYRINQGYVELFLMRGDYQEGEFTSEAQEMAEMLQNRFHPGVAGPPDAVGDE